MAIPKRKRRTIHINGVIYEYAVSGYVRIYIRNTETGVEHKEYFEVKPKWRTQITPGEVKEMIIKAGI